MEVCSRPLGGDGVLLPRELPRQRLHGGEKLHAHLPDRIILNLILIPGPLGIQGAAIATCASYLVVFLIRAADVRRFIPFKLYTLGIIENCVILAVQILFMVLELPGWVAVQIIGLAVMLWLNRTPLLSTFNRVLSMRKK